MTIPRNLSFLAQGASATGVLSVPYGGTGNVTLTAGYIPYGNGTGALASSSNLTFDGSNLKASGSITSSVANSATKQLSLSATNGANADCNIWLSTNYTLIAPSTATPLAFGTATTEQMRLFSSGGVSIGNTTDPSSGGLRLSGLMYPQQATTAAAPAYVKGAIYFDTTLNKLRVGGATGWETITSV